MRGDRPFNAELRRNYAQFTPHARGSTLALTCLPTKKIVYPACAGIDLSCVLLLLSDQCLPRMRGDRPLLLIGMRSFLLFTPHARGSTLWDSSCHGSYCVYPACAGIDRYCKYRSTKHFRLPRMRGDRPSNIVLNPAQNRFTPHARGSTPARSRFL